MAQPDYGEIQTVLNQIMGNDVRFEEMVAQMTEGESLFLGTNWAELLGNVLLGQLHTHGESIGYLVLLILSAAILSAIAGAFKSRQISDMGFYMIYLLLFLIMMRSFGVCYTLTESVIADLIAFMKVLMPAYLMAAAAVAYRTSALVYYEGFFLLIYYVQKFVAVILLPAIRCYVLLTMLGYLGADDFFAKGRKGLKKLILFALKSMIGISAGLQMVQGMITPAIDELKHTVISRGVSSLGGVGNITQNVTDVILGSGVLLKNGIGVAAAVVILVICLTPAVQVAGYMLFYQVLAAVSEPVSDKRLTNMVHETGEGIGLLVKLLFTVCAMFLLTIAIVCVTTGGMV